MLSAALFDTFVKAGFTLSLLLLHIKDLPA